MLDDIGVVCLTETRDNLLMWAHYANEHKGVVLSFPIHQLQKFNIFDSIFPISECLDNRCFLSECFDGKFHRVKYRKQPKFKLDKFDRCYSLDYRTDLTELLFEIMLQKSDEWIYEKEHRAILHLAQADRVLILENEDTAPHVASFLNELEDLFQRLGIEETQKFYSKTSNKPGENSHTFDLHKISDSFQRAGLAYSLLNLSREPEIIYLFKLAKGSVSEITLGVKHDWTTSVAAVEKSPNLTSRFLITEATIEPNSYALSFNNFEENF
jgi:hypothetical protein